MKSKKVLILISILCFSILLVSGCYKSEQVKEPSGNEADFIDSSMNITFLGMSSTGPGLIVANGVAECINKSYVGSTVTIVPGNSGTNVTRINNKDADLALSDNIFFRAGINGSYPYDSKMDNLAAVAYINPHVIQVAASKSLGITTLDEIINNKKKVRISLGMAGGSWPLFMKNYLAEYGCTIEDMADWGCDILYQGIDDSAKMLADNRIDVLVAAVFIPTPTITELSRNKDIILLQMDPDIMDKISAKHGYQKTIIPADTYAFLEEDISSVNTKSILITQKEAPEEDIYKIVRALADNMDYFQSVHSSLAGVTEETIIGELDYPLHPGAEKYYRENGLLK